MNKLTKSNLSLMSKSLGFVWSSSLTPNVLRSLTLTPGKMKPKDVAAAPKLPDVRSCCMNAGVTHYGCVEKLCDPTKTFEIVVSPYVYWLCSWLYHLQRRKHSGLLKNIYLTFKKKTILLHQFFVLHIQFLGFGVSNLIICTFRNSTTYTSFCHHYDITVIYLPSTSDNLHIIKATSTQTIFKSNPPPPHLWLTHNHSQGARLTCQLQVTDLMICAPWAGVTFGCLANGMDHTPCCRSRGLPESCLPLCSGNITTLDFNHFK